MNFDGQNLVVLLLVVAAGGYLARGVWQSVTRRKSVGCGSCGHCPTSSGGDEPRVVGIQPRSNDATTVSASGTRPEAPGS